MRIPPTADRDFTASAYVVREDRVLLVRHPSMDRWVQPGGHVEPRETPDEAAKREVTEETGYRIRIEDAGMDGPSPEAVPAGLPRPFSVAIFEVRPDHWHVDFGYVGSPIVDPNPDHSDGDHEYRWVDGEELGSLETDAHTRTVATRAIERSGPGESGSRR